MDKVEKRVILDERRYIVEQLMKHKRSEEWEVLEEVFDRPTLLNLYQLLNRKVITKIHGAIKAGKESRIYWGERSKGEEVAIKIYLTISSEFKKGMLNYILGDPRFPKVKRDTRSLVQLWAKKEFKNLSSAYKAGVRVPRPLTVSGNILIMEFIGSKGSPAPLLKETSESEIEMEKFYKRILGLVYTLYNKAELVHADLSEYNVLLTPDPVLIDLSMGTDRASPMAGELLLRDLEKLTKYFRRLGVETLGAGELVEKILGNSS